jgi:hypothetical protein
MATILGLRDTSTFTADRFENWRRVILYLYPNGKAPLTALLSLTEPEETNDPHYNWYQKPLPNQRSVLSQAFLSTDMVIKVANAVYRQGHVVLDELTGEIMEVTMVDSTGLNLSVIRGNWGAAAASSGASDPITVIGNVNAEGGFVPQSLSIDPTPFKNYTQIFRTPLELTGTSMNTALKYDRTGPYKEELREKLAFHSIEMEKSFLFGKLAEYNDPQSGKLKRTTQGIIGYLPAGYQVTPANASGLVTQAEWSGWLELVFRYVSNQANEKLMLVGSGMLNALNTMALQIGKMETVAGDEAFGMALTRWYTPFGTVYLRTHPLFTQHPVWRYNGLILDIHNLVYRHVIGRDTQRLINRQANDQDARIDEFLTESGLEVHHFGLGLSTGSADQGTHLYITNVTGTTGS